MNNKNIKKLQKIIDKLYKENNNNQKTQVIVLNRNRSKLDVIYEDVFKVKGYYLLKNSVKASYNILSEIDELNRRQLVDKKEYNSFDFENDFTNNTSLKFDYYESIWAFTKLPAWINQQRDTITAIYKRILKSYSYSLKDDVRTNIENKVKSKHFKPFITSTVNSEFKNHNTKLKIHYKNPDIIKNKPIVKHGNLTSTLELNIKIFSHPALEWSNWRFFKSDITPGVLLQDLNSKKGVTPNYNNAMFATYNNVAHNPNNIQQTTATIISDNDCCKTPLIIKKCLWTKKGKDQLLKFSFKDCKYSLKLFESKNCGKVIQKKNITIDNNLKIASVKTYNNSNHITLYINSSIDPIKPICLETESTDQDPYKIRLKTCVEIPTIIVEDIWAEGGKNTGGCAEDEDKCGDEPWKLSRNNLWRPATCDQTITVEKVDIINKPDLTQEQTEVIEEEKVEQQVTNQAFALK